MAAPNTAEVRLPSVKVLSSSEATDSLRIEWPLPASPAAAGLPKAKYSLHNAGGSTTFNPTAAALISRVAKEQQKIFSDPEKGEIEVDDGKGNKFKFTGFESSAHHEVLVGNVNNGATLVHPCAKLSLLNTSIYRGLSTEVKEVISSNSTTIPDFLKEVLNKLMEAFESSIETDTSLSEDERTINKNIHAINKKINTDYWETVLEGTGDDVNFEGFAEFASNNFAKIIEAIQDVYINAAEDFFIKIDQFSAMFQMLFIPDYAYMLGVGKFISYKSVIQNAEEKEVNVISIGMQCGNKTFFPQNAVLMKGVPKSSVKQATPSTYNASLACWPSEIKPTDIVSQISLPPWIPADISADKVLVSKEATALDPEQYEGCVDDQDESVKEKVSDIEKICKDYCRTYYGFNALSNSSATISTLLDLSWEPGKRYSVKQVGAEKLFDGFLLRVDHSISSTRDGSSAITQLTFSWVEANGFVLPNK